MSPPDTPTRVAILGGGMASLATVAQLVRQQANGGPRCDITIYQLGWRVGGKGASGRNTSGPTSTRPNATCCRWPAAPPRG